MKKFFLILAISLFMAGTILTSCHSSAKKGENTGDKVTDAKDNVIESQQALNKAIKDSIQQFKKESEEKIAGYEKSIAEYKVKIANEKKETKVKYEKKLAELEQKSNNLKKKLADYKDAENEKWISFKNEFNHDMDELGKALKGFTVKNK